MAPRKKRIPLEDVTILGLKTLQDEDWTHEAMARYYTEKLGEPYSRRTIERELKKLKENKTNDGRTKN